MNATSGGGCYTDLNVEVPSSDDVSFLIRFNINY